MSGAASASSSYSSRPTSASSFNRCTIRRSNGLCNRRAQAADCAAERRAALPLETTRAPPLATITCILTYRYGIPDEYVMFD